MRITSIDITNLAAFKEFKVNLPAVGLIEGAHGVGKSSLERIICAAFGLRPLAEKGQKSVMHDPSLLHGTSEKGECTITFEDGNSLRLRVATDKTERHIKVPGKKSWELAGQQIYDITNALSYNPLQFRDLDPKQRLEAFLKVVPVEISTEEIKTAVGDVVPVSGGPSLESINAIYEDIFKARTSENSAVDTQTKYAAQLEAALGPVAPGENWDAEVARLRSDKVTLDASEQAEIQRIGRELQAKRDQVSLDRQSDSGKIDLRIKSEISVIQAQIDVLKTQIAGLEVTRESEWSALASKATADIDALRAAANAEAAEIKTANAPLHAKLTADIATAEERARKSAQDEGTRSAAVEARKQADEHAAQSKAMTEALDRLRALKAEVAGRMKIKGVTVASPREGQPVDICRLEGEALVPFASWNSADQDQFCLKIAMLYRGPCGLVMIDNVSNWNAERKAAIIAGCRKYAAEGMQFLLGEASDGELRITDVTEAKS